jgi:hypothetical protein
MCCEVRNFIQKVRAEAMFGKVGLFGGAFFPAALSPHFQGFDMGQNFRRSM